VEAGCVPAFVLEHVRSRGRGVCVLGVSGAVEDVAVHGAAPHVV
jgi:hydrogenase maturation factor